MRRLMLLRHAKTENDAPSGRDRDRRLDDRGRLDAAEIGGWIGRHPPLPDLVLVSTAVRAQQTWENACEAIRELAPCPHAENVPELYGAETTQLLGIIRTAAADPRTLLVVAHNPGLHELALALAGAGDEAGRKALGENLPTSGLAIFDFAIDSWDDVAFRGGHLAQFVSPKLLKQTLE